MNFRELQDNVKLHLQDASPGIAIQIPDFLNEAYREISEEVEIPSLKTLSTISTVVGTYLTNMPSGFSGRLLFVGADGAQIQIAVGGLQELLEEYPSLDTEGDVVKVALEGSLLYYQGIPATATTLTILYYAEPTELSGATDIPTHIPTHLHRSCLVYKAVAKGYNIIEDGIEGEKLMTLKFENLYQTEGLAKMKEWIEKRRKHVSRSIWSV